MEQQASKRSGQGMVQYIILISLISASALIVFSSFGNVNRAHVSAISNEIAGNSQEAKNSIQTAQNYAEDASNNAEHHQYIGNYFSSSGINNSHTQSTEPSTNIETPGLDANGTEGSNLDSIGTESSGGMATAEPEITGTGTPQSCSVPNIPNQNDNPLTINSFLAGTTP